MYKLLSKLVCDILIVIRLEKIFDYLKRINFKLKLVRYERESNCQINFIYQGGYNLEILGDLSKFNIDKTSHIKSNAVIECTGGVQIGRYFHTGRGLTIFSANHNWKKANRIPYDEQIITKKVTINDFVWCGANVFILPGVTIGEGAIIAGGSVVVSNVPKCKIYGGNPAVEIGERDLNAFNLLKNQKLYH